MPTFIALLRGVNVGTAKRLPMAELRTLLTVCLQCAHGIRASEAAKALLGKAGKSGAVPITTRNWAAVLKLQALAHARA